MKKLIAAAVMAWTVLGASVAFSQVKMTKEQMMFYTSDWKGDRYPDGRPKVPDELLKRALDVSIEDVWDYLRGEGYHNQFEGGWQALHIEKAFRRARADSAIHAHSSGHGEGDYGGR